MYQILCDGYILHDATIDTLKSISPKCSLEINKTGLLSFKLPPTHPYYDKIKKHSKVIEQRIDDFNLRKQELIDSNNFYLTNCKKYNNNCIIIDNEYEITI